MRKLTDQQFDRRVSTLKSRLEQSAATHFNLIDDLRSEKRRRWTCAEMMEPGDTDVEVIMRIRYNGRSAPSGFGEIDFNYEEDLTK